MDNIRAIYINFTLIGVNICLIKEISLGLLSRGEGEGGGVKGKEEGKYCKSTNIENVKVKTNFAFAQHRKVMQREVILTNKRGK